MWREDDWSDFGSYWAAQVEDARIAAGGVGWVEEYAWNTGGCDPCSGTPPDDEQVNALGWTGTAWETYFTRLHVQYEVDAVHQDLSFYTGGISGSDQIRFIVYDEQLEDRFLICGEETPDDPGSCDESSTEDDSETDGAGDGDGDADGGPGPDASGATQLGAYDEGGKSGCSCAVQAAPAGLLAWLGLGLGWGRRRR
jgi:MYXO-CTERM domain-containing protein